MLEDPSKPSPDWEAMRPYWEQVNTIIEGAEAMRTAGQKYLPKFNNESTEDYDFRRKCAKFTNVYRDIIEGLASKPFAQELGLADGSSGSIQTIAEDIDGRGNNLHTFAAECFFAGINRAIDWILVDYTKSDGSAKTKAEESQAGVRPYWVHVPANSVIDVQSEIIQGREQLTLVKILETAKRVRQFERMQGFVAWTVFEEVDDKDWQVTDEGTITLAEIPMVPFITGRRKGTKWQFHPPMRDAADLQVELYQAETGLKHIKTLTCFPMLAGNGVNPVMDGETPMRVPVGPQAVLYAPMGHEGRHGEWKWITTDAPVLQFLADDVESTIKQMRELGRQPLTAQSGNLTKITSAVASAKGNSAVQMWALGLKDALEQALKYTAMWLNDNSEPEVKIHTDFGIDEVAEVAPGLLLDAVNNGQITQRTFHSEWKRYSILSPEFDEEAEARALRDELTDDDEETPAITRTG